jgi:16S rRNA (adenine1518-N6/adenine1519-N6)-dimethyltransferase
MALAPAILQAIDALPPLRDVVNDNALRADKSFGQNFLFDLNLTGKIARAAGDLKDATIIEVGPGPGGLTRALLTETAARQIIAIEKDRRVIPALSSLVKAAGGHLQLLEEDALHFDYQTVPAPKAIVANLPYNIATPLLIHWLHHADQFISFTLMFQREVAERLFAPAGSKAYGRLSVLTQLLCTGHIVFDLPPEAFTPPPKVTSSVVRLIPRPEMEFAGQDKAILVEKVEQVTKMAFGQRRKMLRQSLKPLNIDWDKVGIDQTKRAEDLTVSDYVRLASLV